MIRNYKRGKTFVHEPIELGYEPLKDSSEKSGRVYQTPEGKKYPSVTTVLGIRGKDAIQEWRNRVGAEEANRIARHAATRGTAVHNLAERYLNNEERVLNGDEMPHVLKMFKALTDCMDNSIGRVILQEKALYSNHLGLAGRVDLVAEFDGRLSIVDFKTSSRVKDIAEISCYFIQACAYAIMFEERTGIPVNNLVIVMLVEGRDEAVVFKQRRDTWAAELIKVIEEYNTAKLFGHV